MLAERMAEELGHRSDEWLGEIHSQLPSPDEGFDINSSIIFLLRISI